MGDDVLEHWVIYDHPKDFPGHFVVRRWRVVQGNPEPVPDPRGREHLAATLEEARGLIPDGLFRTAPTPEDDPVIAEVWL